MGSFFCPCFFFYIYLLLTIPARTVVSTWPIIAEFAELAELWLLFYWSKINHKLVADWLV